MKRGNVFLCDGVQPSTYSEFFKEIWLMVACFRSSTFGPTAVRLFFSGKALMRRDDAKYLVSASGMVAWTVRLD